MNSYGYKWKYIHVVSVENRRVYHHNYGTHIIDFYPGYTFVLTDSLFRERAEGEGQPCGQAVEHYTGIQYLKQVRL